MSRLLAIVLVLLSAACGRETKPDSQEATTAVPSQSDSGAAVTEPAQAAQGPEASVLLESYTYTLVGSLGGKAVTSTVNLRRQSTVFVAIVYWQIEGQDYVHHRDYTATLNPAAFALEPVNLFPESLAVEFEYELGADGVERLVPSKLTEGGETVLYIKK